MKPKPPRVLGLGTLARFATPLTWPEIHALDPTITKKWWSDAVLDAECRGLLRYLMDRKAWTLTDAGRRQTRDVA